MITNVRSAGIFVGDQDRAKRFWTETMGFELIQDTPMGEESGAKRWIEVRAPGDDTILVLFTPPGQESFVGTFSNVIFDCDDLEATHAELKAKGVEFSVEPKMESWGAWWSQFKDPDGNEYGLGQRGG
jgi:lactoylglutathione lyase